MGFTNQEREAFLGLFQDLGPPAPGEASRAYVEARLASALEEVSAVPGHDQVRAGLLRVLGHRLEGEERSVVAAAARVAIDAYMGALDEADFDPLLLLSRHPSWVAVASLELDRWSGVPAPRSLDRAVSLATAGFQAVGDGQATGRGEVLWAIAEQADDVGWSQTAATLYQAAMDAPFATAGGSAQVRLLLALRWVEDRDARAEALLSTVATDEVAPHRSRVHAAWVLAALHGEAGRAEEALALLELARSMVDDEEPEVGQRIDEAMRTLREA